MPESIRIRIDAQNLSEEQRVIFTGTDIILLNVRHGERFDIYFRADGFPLLLEHVSRFSQVRPVGRDKTEFQRKIVFFSKAVVALFPAVVFQGLISLSRIKFKFLYIVSEAKCSRRNRRKYFLSFSRQDISNDRLPVDCERQGFSHFTVRQNFAFLLIEKKGEVARNIDGENIAASLAFQVGKPRWRNITHSENLLVIVSLKQGIFIKEERELHTCYKRFLAIIIFIRFQ